MCGLAVYYAFDARAALPPPSALLAMQTQLAARGPDGAGLWTMPDRRVGLVHRRLAILDLSEQGRQPMCSADGLLSISFNGEIYNYPALRQALEADGVQFRSHSDTEVLLHLYQREGAVMLARLRGMFACALWDARRQGLLLARDPYGIKPLYYSIQSGCLYVASQVRALLASGQVSHAPDPTGRAGLLLWGSIPEPWTAYEAIKSLEAGSNLWVDAHGPRPQSYFSWPAHYQAIEAAGTVQPNGAEVQAALQASVQAHLLADVPVGAFLSAGVDSASLVGLMRTAGVQDLTTVTLAFAEFRGQAADEAPLAAQIARHYQTRHHTVTVSAADFRGLWPDFLAAMDQPSIDGLNTWLVSRAARQVGLKVVMSGLGGDELLGGYPSFRDVPRLVRWGQVPGGTQWRQLLYRLGVSPKWASLGEYSHDYLEAYLLRRAIFLPWELPALLGRERALTAVAALLGAHRQLSLPRTAFARVACLESSRYLRNQLLRDSDWASMAHGVELRTPWVDVPLSAQVTPHLLTLPLGTGKGWLAQAPRQPPLPAWVTQRPKTGFTTPIATWLQDIPTLDAWRQVPQLRQPRCHWSRRLAYGLWAGSGLT